MSTDRYQSWAESYRKAAAMREQTLDRLSRPKAPPPPPDRPRIEGIIYTPTPPKE